MPANLGNTAVATDWERSVFIPIPKKGNAKNVQTTTELHSPHMPGLKEPLVESERGE